MAAEHDVFEVVSRRDREGRAERTASREGGLVVVITDGEGNQAAGRLQSISLDGALRVRLEVDSPPRGTEVDVTVLHASDPSKDVKLYARVTQTSIRGGYSLYYFGGPPERTRTLLSLLASARGDDTELDVRHRKETVRSGAIRITPRHCRSGETPITVESRAT